MNNILFDLDGTLTDPYEGITNSILFALEKLAVSPPTNLHWCIGPPLQDTFGKLLKGSDKSVDEAIYFYREYFGEKGKFENEPYSGIKKCLKALNQAGKSLFVATSKPHFYAQQITDYFELSKYFRHIHGSELDLTRTNKIDLIEYILKIQDLDPNQTVMVGDRKHDLIGAHKNSVASIGITWGYGSHEELHGENPSAICSTISELTEELIGFRTE